MFLGNNRQTLTVSNDLTQFSALKIEMNVNMFKEKEFFCGEYQIGVEMIIFGNFIFATFRKNDSDAAAIYIDGDGLLRLNRAVLGPDLAH